MDERPRLSANALRVLRARHLRRDAGRQVVETPGELFARVARAVAEAELAWGGASDVDRRREEFLSLLLSLDFLPNSPTLMNAGSELGQLAACFVRAWALPEPALAAGLLVDGRQTAS